MMDVLDAARKALEIEIAGLRGLVARLDSSFEEAVNLVLACDGKVAVTGMGKSGHVGQKIAATLASTGTTAFFLHPAEAIHGDLGMVASGDIALAISNSGETEEVVRLLAPLRRIGVPIIAMTGNPKSELAKRSQVHLDVSVAEEACPLGLAPTASTTAAVAMGDALAVTLLTLRGFTPEEYAKFHPGGNLGKKLMTTVNDLMESGAAVPTVRGDQPVKEAIPEILEKNYGLTAVTDNQGELKGVFSIGDLTRLHLKDPTMAFMEHAISEFMTAEPRTVPPDALAAGALNVMETHNIRALFVVDATSRPIGIIGLYEVLRAIDY
ncbi:MAG: KpsF/GutQ family sugar-phosphate isomerase [bacterium]